MDSSPRQQHNNGREYAVKILELLLNRGIQILDEHKDLLSHHLRFLKTTQDQSAEAKADSQDKSSLSFSGAGHNKLVDILHIAAAYVDKKGECGGTPLHLAAETGDTELVDILLQAGADVDAEDTSKQTPLHCSAKYGHIGVVESLIKAGADVNAEDEYKQTPLYCSAKYGQREVVESLLKVGANVNAEDEYKQTPLHCSANYGDRGVVDSRLKSGANVNAEDEYKQTPLHCSANYGDIGVVESLLKSGANVNARDTYKQTPLHISVIYKHDSVAALLVNAGASAENIDIYRRNVFDYMDEKQKMKFLFYPNVWSNMKQYDRSFDSTKTKIEHLKNISTTYTLSKKWSDVEYFINEHKTFHSEHCLSMPFNDRQTTPVDYPIPCGSSSTNSEDRPKHSSTLPTPESSRKKPAATPSIHESLYVPSPPTESHKSSQDLDSIRRQVENHWHKFSFEPTKEWETSLSHDVQVAFQAGRIVMPTTINVTQNKIIKNIKKIKQINHYEPDHLNISHAENVAPGGQIIVHHTKKITMVDDFDEDDSCSDDGSYIYF